MLLDWQNHTYGKWRPSAVAARHGSIAITLDRLISRDRFPVEQAIEHIRSAHPHVDPLELRKLAAALPQRCRRELVPWHTTTVVASAVGFEDPLESAHREQEMCVRRTALARALATLTRDERRLIWLRYRRRLTVRDVAGQIGADPKPLYQRFDRILLALRRRLLKEGITSASTLERRASGSAGDRVRIHPLLTDTIVVAAE
jgi:DNA-directed RNA polymerase specialized sigma24 family protein